MGLNTYLKVFALYFVYLSMCLALGFVLAFFVLAVSSFFLSELASLKILYLYLKILFLFSFSAPILAMFKLLIWARERSERHSVPPSAVVTEAIFYGHDFFENDDEEMAEHFGEIMEFSFFHRWWFMFEFRIRNVFFFSMIFTLAWLILGEIKGGML